MVLSLWRSGPQSGLTQFKMPAFSAMILFFTFTVLCLANCVVSCRRVLVYALVTTSEIGRFSELVSVVDLFLDCAARLSGAEYRIFIVYE